MSAPRKICINHLQSRMIDLNGKGGTEVYHHDDVVRELIAALERARGYIDIGRDRHGPVLRQIDTALAKIAQDG